MNVNKIVYNVTGVINNTIHKTTNPISVSAHKIEASGNISKYLETQGAYNKASFNIAQKAKEVSINFNEQFEKLFPEGFQYFRNAEGQLTAAPSQKAPQLAKDAFFHKYISQIEEDNKAVDTFTNRLSGLFSEDEKAQMDIISDLSQKRINPKRMENFREVIGIDSGDKTDDELVKNIVNFVESKKATLSEEDGKKILDSLRKIDGEKIKEQASLAKKLQNALSRLAADEKAYETEQKFFQERIDKITTTIDDAKSVKYISLDGIKHKEMPNETIVVSKSDIEALKKLKEKYDFLNVDDIHLQQRIFQRYGGATADGASINMKAVDEVLGEIQTAFETPAEELLQGMPDVNGSTPKLGLLLSKGRTSREHASLLMPVGNGTFENIVLDKNKNLVTIISDVTNASVQRNFIPAFEVKPPLVY